MSAIPRRAGEFETSKPLPYYPQPSFAWWKRLLIGTIGRRFKCRRWFCWRPATEVGYVCDFHGGHID